MDVNQLLPRLGGLSPRLLLKCLGWTHVLPTRLGAGYRHGR